MWALACLKMPFKRESADAHIACCYSSALCVLQSKDFWGGILRKIL